MKKEITQLHENEKGKGKNYSHGKLKIKKGYNETWIVYNPFNFDACHTHTAHLRIARVIQRNVNKFCIPKSRDRRTIISHIRVSTDNIYLERLQEILNEIDGETNKNNKKVGETYGSVD